MRFWVLYPLALLLPVLGSDTFGQSATGDRVFTADQVGILVTTRGRAEERDTWNLGPSSGQERSFEVTWDLYDSPKDVEITWTEPRGRKTHKLTAITGVGSHEVTLPANAEQSIEVRVATKAANGGWQYSVAERRPSGNSSGTPRPQFVRLRPDLKPQAHRRIFGTNLSADLPLRFSKEKIFFPRYKDHFTLVYRVDVPKGSTAFRVRAPKGVHLWVAKNQPVDPSRPGRQSAARRPTSPLKPIKVSQNNSVHNAVTYDYFTVSTGSYYITAARKPLPPITLDTPVYAGDLQVDCFQTGIWSEASFSSPLGSQGNEPELILVGIENRETASPQFSEPQVVLLIHGRTNSPIDMGELGASAGYRWATDPVQGSCDINYINWSEGSYSNQPEDFGLQGSRYISSTAAGVQRLLRNIARGNLAKVDALAHSWGTYLGWAIACGEPDKFRGLGKYHRFFALDPAMRPTFDALGFAYPAADKIDFRQAAKLSITLYGVSHPVTGFGDPLLSLRAHERINIYSPLTPDTGPLRLDVAHKIHLQPKDVMAQLLHHREAVYRTFAMSVRNLTGPYEIIGDPGSPGGLEQGFYHVGIEKHPPLEPGGLLVPPEYIPASIEFTDRSISLDFAQSGSGQFEEGDFNGISISYTASLMRNSRLLSAAINTGSTTLPLTSGRISVENDTININLAGLSYGPGSRVVIDLQLRPTVEEAFGWILDKKPDVTRRPWASNGLTALQYPGGSYEVKYEIKAAGKGHEIVYQDRNSKEAILTSYDPLPLN